MFFEVSGEIHKIPFSYCFLLDFGLFNSFNFLFMLIDGGKGWQFEKHLSIMLTPQGELGDNARWLQVYHQATA